GTNPLYNDTVGVGLSDAQEFLFFGSDPLVFDPDIDADAWYWFQDCNDSNSQIHPGMSEILNGIDDNCNDLWDEGFNITDSDNDNLSDFSEYHSYGTNWTNPDTDGDNLTDGDEILIHGSDPLVPDVDNDEDGWYWFQDCNDTNPWVHPDMPEALDGIDNDCDEQIDEDYVGLDSDGDDLLDLNEYNIWLTNPFDNDTDDDGLNDGYEINVTFTNPLVPDLDGDGDGFRWFEDCDDNDTSINPDATEIWDGYDQNCNNLVDELVNRAGQISVLPTSIDVILNATSDSLYLQTFVNIPDNSNLEIQTAWVLKINDNWTIDLSTETWLEIGPFQCEEITGGYVAEICAYNGTTPVYSMTVSISDGYEIITHTWSIQYTVWHPPIPEPEPEPVPEPDNDSEEEDGNSSVSGAFTIGTDTRVIIGLTAIVVVLGVIVLITGRKKSPPPPMRPAPTGIPQMVGQNLRRPSDDLFR
ncbi:MAG: putative metal-binding motif-containing protein, partial [Candidatus Thermoplasmatota archaeon]|nr:putative metal-binding motif-containing protein [Candidatus Thermoplasmatota archaeon]